MRCVLCDKEAEPYHFSEIVQNGELKIEVVADVLPENICESCKKQVIQLAVEKMLREGE